MVGCLADVVVDGVSLSLRNAESSMHVGQCRTDACDASPCNNGGACITDQDALAQCVCRPGYSGPHCEVGGTICQDLNPCRNGGVCRVDGASFQCDCPVGFIGSLCETGKCTW